MLKERIINNIIEIEGGYVDDPGDSGGPTKFGITEAVARQNGYNGDMIEFPRSLAYQIYSRKYWDSLRLDDVCDMSEMIARELADTGVNTGVTRAAVFLQRSLNVLNDKGRYYPDIVIDGDVGDRTLAALRSFVGRRGQRGIEVLHKMLNALQGTFYIRLAERREKDERFVFGWFSHRVE